MTITCPTPDKSRYATNQAADNAASRVQIPIGQHLRPYECPCGWWHLTSQPGPATPNDDTVQTVAGLDTPAFEDLVRRDLRGHATPHEAGALRHPAIAARWEAVLLLLRVDLEGQFARRKEDRSNEARDWRRRATIVRATLAIRRKEARGARHRAGHGQHSLPTAEQEANAQLNADRRAARDRHLDDIVGAVRTRAEEKELLRIAGEHAIKRLIDAHGAEFTSYLAEECQRIGVEPPKRVRKHLEQEAA